MTCHEILTTLLLYQLQLMKALGLSPHPDLTIEISNEYSFVAIHIQKSGKEFADISFELNEDTAKIYKIYCEDRSAEEGIRERMNGENWPGWRSSSSGKLPYPEEIIQSLYTADRIASLTMNCTKGDNYRPGNFSKVSVNSERIELQQINLMHAKSIDHKQDYIMRKLVFTIPFDRDTTAIKRFDSQQVGNMTVEFSDNSSKNNRECGKTVIKELEKIAQ